MARPIKHTVEYFSHDANASQGKTLTILENNYGIAGYAAWFKLLEVLSTVDNHVFKCRNSEDKEYLAARLKLKTKDLDSILDKMADLEAIDKNLWQHGIIWSEKFVLRLKDVYDNRRQPLPTRPSNDITTPNLQTETPLLQTETPLPSVENTQSKLKETKVNNTLPQKASELATLLKGLILTNNPKALLKENVLPTWGKTFDLMLSKDKRDPQDIEAVIRWCPRMMILKKLTCLSADKIRSRFDSLYMKMNSNNNGHGKQQSPVSMYKYANEEAGTMTTTNENTILPPHDIAAEEALLASILVDETQYDEVSLAPADFYHEPHRFIWQSFVTTGKIADYYQSDYRRGHLKPHG
jgi:hypothetical protein